MDEQSDENSDWIKTVTQNRGPVDTMPTSMNPLPMPKPLTARQTKPNAVFTTLSEGQTIDDDAGIIRNVNVITKGKTRGHDLEVDDKTLAQILEASQSYSNGVKVKADHGSGVFSIVGSVRDFRVDGDHLKGDLHLLKTAGNRQHIIELARELPDTFGLSVSIVGDHEKRNGTTYARCKRIRSVDIVADPAANPSGLLHEGDQFDRSQTYMDDAQLKELNEWREAVAKQVNDLQTAIQSVTAGLKELSEADEPVTAEALADTVKELEGKIEAVTELAKRGGAPAPAPGAPPAKPEGPTNFDEAVAAVRKDKPDMKQTEAILEAAAKYPELRLADLRAKGLQL